MTRDFTLTHRWAEIEVVDVHVGGDLHRIIVDGIRPLPGATALEQMQWPRDNGDGLRQLVPPCRLEADIGYSIMETMGYPLISGANTMSTAIALLETGCLPMHGGDCKVTLEAPGGSVEVMANCEGGKVRSVTYEVQTPSFVSALDLQVEGPISQAFR